MINSHRFSRVIQNFINGKWKDSNTTSYHEAKCPLTGKLMAKVPLTTDDEFNEAVEAA